MVRYLYSYASPPDPNGMGCMGRRGPCTGFASSSRLGNMDYGESGGQGEKGEITPVKSDSSRICLRCKFLPIEGTWHL